MVAKNRVAQYGKKKQLIISTDDSWLVGMIICFTTIFT